MSEKQCTKCGLLKSLDSFNKCGKKSGALYSRCKSCVYEYKVEWRKKHSDIVLARNAEWKKMNPENVRKYASNAREKLKSSYIKRLISFRVGCSFKDIPEALVEAKRAYLAIDRLIKEKSK